MKARDLRMEIEGAVRARQRNRVDRLTKTHLRIERNSHAARLEVAEWYRRMQWFRQGYLLLRPQPVAHESEAEESALRIRRARFLHGMGASAQALAALRDVRLSSAFDHRVAGEIFLGAYEPELALQSFITAEKTDPEPTELVARFGRVGRAKALIGLGKFAEATEVLRSLRDISDEKFFRGILLRIEGECLARAGRFADARRQLGEALLHFPDRLEWEHGELFQWIGYVEAKFGETARARDAFRQALRILENPAVPAEKWLEVYRWMDRSQFLQGRLPWILRSYPGLPKNFHASAPREVREVGRRNAPYWISECRDEWSFEGQSQLGLSRELQLAGILRRADDFGISRVRAQSLLWPNEPEALPELEKRLHVLLHRLRKVHGFQPEVVEGKVTLPVQDRQKIRVEHASAPLPPRFFVQREHFRPTEFRRYYALKKSQAAGRIRDAITSGVISRIPGRAGPSTEYRVEPQARDAFPQLSASPACLEISDDAR